MDNRLLCVGDVVGVIYKDSDGNETVTITHLVDISPDVKKGWWLVTLRFIPAMIEMSWLLDDNQLHQQEFTMGGNYRRLVLMSRAELAAIPEKESKLISLTEEDSLF